MTIQIGYYEVEIKAKQTPYTARFNKDDTMRLLNMLSIYASEAAENMSNHGSIALAEQANEISDQIYNVLKENGAYNN